ncbi:MAG: hypothetical protein J0M04_15760 [Verrucomicrobia bacterium]|nr:hypothetical protein [Verrucomicrobiota bacterium]
MAALSDLNQLLLEGRLMAAVEACKLAVRSQPSKLEPRVALYELSIFLADWDRCKNQVETIMSLGGDPMHWLGHMANIHASAARTACWQGRSRPPVLGECDEDDQAMFDALWQTVVAAISGNMTPLEEHNAEFGGMVFGPGRANGVPFEELSTVDSRLPGILEVSDGGDYAWLWLGAVSRIEMPGRAANLSEVPWIPSRVFFTNGEVKSLTIFGLYPGTELSTNPKVVLGRETEWDEASESLSLGSGGQLFYIDDAPVPFQQVRLIEFTVDAQSDDASEPATAE